METNTTIAGNLSTETSQTVLNGFTEGKEYSDERVRQLVAALEEPFDPQEIKWRVTNTTADKRRGQMLAYADPRAYTDRLNELLTVRGWTRDYSIQTINNVERKLSNGSQFAGKVVVTCKVTIHGLGTHSGIGEEWADNENAGTAAEAQAFKRACSCFGLGRYLYNLEGCWVELDERRQPKSTPKLPDWAIPKRKQNVATSKVLNGHAQQNGRSGQNGYMTYDVNVLRIKSLSEQVGFGLSRSILLGMAKTEEPEKVPPALASVVCSKLEDTLRGVERLRRATAIVGHQRYSQLCRDLNFASDALDDIPDRNALRRLIEILEKEAGAVQNRRNGAPSAPGSGPARQTADAAGRTLAEARSQLIKEAQRVARLKGMKVAEVVDRAAKGTFTFGNLQTLTAETLPTIRAATDLLRRVV